MSAFNTTFSKEHQSMPQRGQSVVREIPQVPTGRRGRSFDPVLVAHLAQQCDSRGEILFHLGVSRESWYFRTLAFTAATHNIALPVHDGKPAVSEWQTVEALTAAFADNATLEGVCADFEISPCGTTYARIRKVAEALDVDVPTWAQGRTYRTR